MTVSIATKVSKVIVCACLITKSTDLKWYCDQMKPCSNFTHQLEAEDSTTLTSEPVVVVQLQHHLGQQYLLHKVS